jgi:formylglycine-generating enzyme required for sulfatase activity
MENGGNISHFLEAVILTTEGRKDPVTFFITIDFCIFNCMKIFLLFLTICFAFANAQFYYDKHGESRGAYKDSLEHATLVGLAERFHGSILVKKPIKGVKPRKNLKKIPENKIQRTFDVNRDSLRKELWLEVEKNEFVKICVDGPVVAWETSLNSSILNDSCLAFQAPIFVGVESINVYLPESDSPHKINLAVGMKYLDFKNEEVLLGFNKRIEFRNREIIEDPERNVFVTGTYLVDKYPVTNCEILQMMWDSIPLKTSFDSGTRQDIGQIWAKRKKASTRNKSCAMQDSAACTIYLFQAMKYANARSIRDGLKPYYIFSTADKQESFIISKGKYIIKYLDFIDREDIFIQITADYSSDGYRLPYYDEWMMFARGGDKKNPAPWGDTTATFEEASKYAQFNTDAVVYESGPVGQLKPNGYGLYDMFGLVWEHVLFEERNPFIALRAFPSCLKGGDDAVRKDEGEWYKAYMNPYWKDINYGYSRSNYTAGRAEGFRLIRNIGNNAKWSEVKSK